MSSKEDKNVFKGSFKQRKATFLADVSAYFSLRQHFTDEEKLIIDTLCNEMSIPASYDINLSFDDVLEKLKDIKSLSKKRA